MAENKRWGIDVRWARAKGWLQIRDPETGDVHEIESKDAPPAWRRQAQRAKMGEAFQPNRPRRRA